MFEDAPARKRPLRVDARIKCGERLIGSAVSPVAMGRCRCYAFGEAEFSRTFSSPATK